MWHPRRKHDQRARARPSEATAARQKAERELEKTKAETAVYEELGNRLRKIRERNNFAAAFRHSMQGGPHR